MDGQEADAEVDEQDDVEVKRTDAVIDEDGPAIAEALKEHLTRRTAHEWKRTKQEWTTSGDCEYYSLEYFYHATLGA